ncbi:MAG: alanine racemase [Devosiaceae bacterium]|nr:alanine racemase [Devosiaceae bacterium MH13]
MSDVFHPGGRLTIDLGALANNYRTLRDLSAPGACGAAVKANAYGLGLEPVCRTLRAAGCRSFFVALPEEAFALRGLLADADIYCLGGLTPGGAADYLAQSIRPVLNTLGEVDAWADAGAGSPCALHVDTGMNRLGLTLPEAESLAGDTQTVARLNLQLVMSHLACADTPEHPLNDAQVSVFDAVRALFPGVPASLANSAGVLQAPKFRHALARPGIALYGGASAPVTPNPIKPVVRLDARVMQVRAVPAGQSVGYGAAQTVPRATRLAILGVGYADGYHRLAGASDAQAGGSVAFGGSPAPLVGRISMDLMAADITDVAFDNVQPGDFATLMDAENPVDAVAAPAKTIGYEFLTGFGARYQRVYVGAAD